MVALVVVIAAESLAPLPVAAQAETAAADTWATPRTPWGEPDLQGIWDFRTLTPLERPRQLAGRAFFTEEEAAEREQRAVQRSRNITSQIWMALGQTLTEDRRTSLIVDPPDGRIPPLTPEGQARAAAMYMRWQRLPHGPEDRTLLDRCLLGRTSGPPMIPAAFHYDALVQLFQTPGYVVLLKEMIHEVRIIPLDGRPHLGPTIGQWMGDSRGRWEGHTLVVETTNFSDKTNYGGISFAHAANRTGLLGANTHLIERFTRVDADTIAYEFTVDDPTTFTRPWSVALPMKRTEGPLFEYACHEGNEYFMVMMLGAAGLAETWPTIEVHGGDVVGAGAPVRLQAEAVAHGSARVERVEFVVDGAVVSVDTEAPYEGTWLAEGSGRHFVTATVHDSEGRVASAPATVFVGLRALERSIARTEDDAEELPDGSMFLDIPGLSLGGQGLADQVVGLRFADIRIPRGTPIHEAYLQFTATRQRRRRGTEPTDLTLHAELAGDAVAFSEVKQNISLRKPTAASVNWSPEPWEVASESSVRQRTPNLVALIQEVVNRPDWREGNALVLLISGSGRRRATAYDSISDAAGGARQRLERAPRLYIELAEAHP